LLQRLSFLSGGPIWSPALQQEVNEDEFIDPFIVRILPLPPDKFQQSSRLLLFTDATYIVLCPGDPQKLARIAETAGSSWRNTHFVVDDRNLSITMRLVTEQIMRLDRGQAIPAIIEYDGANHIVDFGRRYHLSTLHTNCVPGPVDTATTVSYYSSSVAEHKSKQIHNTHSPTQNSSSLKPQQ